MDAPISLEEYFSVIKSITPKSAPGPDLISNNIISHFPRVLHIVVLSLFNEMLSRKRYPEQWSSCFVVFVPKPKKKSSYRLISLANNFLKIMEKVMCKRIE